MKKETLDNEGDFRRETQDNEEKKEDVKRDDDSEGNMLRKHIHIPQ